MAFTMEAVKHVYEVRPRKDHRGVDVISDVLPFGRLWYGEPNAAANVNRIRAILQPFTRCSDSRLRCSGQGDRDARAQGRFQRVVARLVRDSRYSPPPIDHPARCFSNPKSIE